MRPIGSSSTFPRPIGSRRASFWVDLKLGYEPTNKLTGDLVQPPTQRGTHGYFPTHPEMNASFFIEGPGIAANRSLRNGLQGEGAGVGLFTPAPGTATFGTPPALEEICATPGLDAGGHLFRADGIVLVPLEAVRDAGLPGVDALIGRLAARLGEEGLP